MSGFAYICCHCGEFLIACVGCGKVRHRASVTAGPDNELRCSSCDAMARELANRAAVNAYAC